MRVWVGNPDSQVFATSGPKSNHIGCFLMERLQIDVGSPRITTRGPDTTILGNQQNFPNAGKKLRNWSRIRKPPRVRKTQWAELPILVEKLHFDVENLRMTTRGPETTTLEIKKMLSNYRQKVKKQVMDKKETIPCTEES